MSKSLPTITITPRKSLFDLQLKEVWYYRDLFVLFVKRDISVTYKQTILGPLWFIIQPLLTTLMFLLVFGRIADISTDGVPPILFYLGGLTIWNYFSESIRLISDTFVKNSGLFGKIYFPRIISPLSVVTSNLIKFGIQFMLFLCVFFFYLFSGSANPNFTLIFLPVYVLVIALMGLAFGLLISAMTTKYRDLTYLIQFGIQLWMYVTPIIYPIAQIPEKYRSFIMANPVSPLVEAFKYGFTSTGLFSPVGILYSSVFAVILFFFSLAVFNRVEKTFMDSV